MAITTSSGGPGGPTGPGGPEGPRTPPEHQERRTTTGEPSTTGYGTYPPLSAYRSTSRVSWSGVFIGAFVMVASAMAILSLGAALGFSTFDPATADMRAIGWGTGLWSVLTLILATFIGAFVSVKATHLYSNRDAAIQGGVVWAFSFLLLTVFAGVIAAAGAVAAVAATEAATPGVAIGEAASWGYFLAALLGAVSGVLGGLAAYPVEDRVKVERRKPVRAPELRTRPIEA